MVVRPKHPSTRICRLPRRGMAAIEAAIVYPVFLLLLLGIILGGNAIFRYQQTALLAREAARWTSVRGADYQADTNSPPTSTQEILQQAVIPFATGMNLSSLTAQVQWVDQSTGTATAWDKSRQYVHSLDQNGEYVTNTVRVTVTYSWSGGLWFLNNLSLRSTSEVPMAY